MGWIGSGVATAAFFAGLGRVVAVLEELLAGIKNLRLELIEARRVDPAHLHDALSAAPARFVRPARRGAINPTRICPTCLLREIRCQARRVYSREISINPTRICPTCLLMEIRRQARRVYSREISKKVGHAPALGCRPLACAVYTRSGRPAWRHPVAPPDLGRRGTPTGAGVPSCPDTKNDHSRGRRFPPAGRGRTGQTSVASPGGLARPA